MEVNVSDKQIVLPGDQVGLKGGKNTISGAIYSEGDKIYAAAVSVINIKELDSGEQEIQVIPLNGTYRPRVGDMVIGYVVDITVTGWEIDIKSPYAAFLSIHEATLRQLDVTNVDLKTILKIGDVILAKIIDVNLSRDYPVTLTLREARLGRIEDGVVVEVDPTKVPRVIGKKGSMANMFREELGCDVTVGQNGRVWIKCKNEEDESFVVHAVKKIEQESHTSGLTDKMKAYVAEYKASRGGKSTDQRDTGPA
ncbi:RNA-binding protein [Thermocladium modestius]|uniref:Exosome complex component Rrp4 n=1 Tax=Thermocladium modestius TaxID=62609 RepID=A0A830GWI8_9CREN|nr:exosome complex RNA-binding protein Rrp4 [Thermocladium modestius]GGP21812.1 RNA-binding protein [Thermocladium modestius]